MKRILVSVSLLCSTCLLRAADWDPKLFRLIGPETKLVTGANYALFEDSALGRLTIGYRIPKGGYQQISIDADDGYRPVLLVAGDAKSAAQFETELGSPRPARSDGFALDEKTAIRDCGLECRRRAARQLAQSGPLSEIGEKALRLSRSYDNWFLAVRPLERFAFGARGESKYFKQLSESVEEASGGIRLGGFNELHIEIVMRTAEDAATLAALAKWLPGLLEFRLMSYQHGIFDLAENLIIQPQGRTVSVSFVIPENKLEGLLKLRHRYYEGVQ